METNYQIVIFAFLVFGFCFFVLPNIIFLKRGMPKFDLPDILPKISVLIPARNEERHIAHAIETLLKDPYPNFEVIILDDKSEDETAKIVNWYADRDTRVKLIRGADLPISWAGKPHACFQLAKAAQGDYLFFSDADTTFHPRILEFSLRAALKYNADLLTGIPRLWSPNFWGRLIMPNVFFLYFGFLSHPMLSTKLLRNSAFGLGSFLFFRKEAYWKIGGHEAIRQVVTEDVALAKNIKSAGLRFRLMDPSLFMESKMYDSFQEIWQGYGKNLFKALGSSYGILIGFLILFTILYLLPFYFLGVYLLEGSWDLKMRLVAGQIALVLFYRLLLSLRYQLSWESIVLHPISIGIMLAISIRSAFLQLTGKGYVWKGRIVH